MFQNPKIWRLYVSYLFILIKQQNRSSRPEIIFSNGYFKEAGMLSIPLYSNQSLELLRD